MGKLSYLAQLTFPKKAAKRRRKSEAERSEEDRVQRLLAAVKGRPCVACAKAPPSDPDHITTRGAGGADRETNLWPLCREHHTLRHQKGLGHMIEKFRSCKRWLEIHGRTDVLERVARDGTHNP